MYCTLSTPLTKTPRHHRSSPPLIMDIADIINIARTEAGDPGWPGPGQDILDYCIEYFPSRHPTNGREIVEYLLSSYYERRMIFHIVRSRSLEGNPRWFCLIHPLLRHLILIHTYTSEGEFLSNLQASLLLPIYQKKDTVDGTPS